MPSSWPLSTTKRAVDILGAGTLLGLAIVPLALLALAIKMDSPGPAFFGQERLGQNGKPFTLWKLRTLAADLSPQSSGFVPGRTLSPTRLGGFLRRTRLNELPQLVNVLRGQMSLVGPRPEVLEYLDVFRNLAPQVLALRPGLTDEATLRYLDEERLLAESDDPQRLYRETILPDKLALATDYLERATFTTDLSLLYRTLKRLLGR